MSNKHEGFEKPNYTQTPNKFYDEILREIDTLSEMKVTQIVMRKTFGWHKRSDRISQSQLVELTGMSRDSVKSGLKSGIERGTIVKVSEFDRKKNQAAEYSLNFKNFDMSKDNVQDEATTTNVTPLGKPSGEAGGKVTREAGGKVTREASGVSYRGTKERFKETNKENKNNQALLVKLIEKNWGRTTSSYQIGTLVSYIDDGLPIEVIEEAIKLSAGKKSPFGYCKGILNNCLADEITDVSEMDNNTNKKSKYQSAAKF